MKKVKVNSYFRNAPVKVRVMGQDKAPIKLTPARPFMDRLEIYFRNFVLGAVAMFFIAMVVSLLGETLGHAMAAPAILEVPYESKILPPILKKICHAESGAKKK